jgi:hypothetical protein
MGLNQNNQLIKVMGGAKTTPTFQHISLHHNLYIGSGGRNPRISNGLGNNGREATDTTADVRNNVIANWASGIGTDAECGAKVNIVENFYSNSKRPTDAIVVRGKNAAGADYAGCHTSSGEGIGAFAHVQGNVSGDSIKVDINTNPQYIKNNQATPFAAPPVTTTDACTAAQQVLAGSGVFPRDDLDEDLVGRVNLGPCAD